MSKVSIKRTKNKRWLGPDRGYEEAEYVVVQGDKTLASIAKDKVSWKVTWDAGCRSFQTYRAARYWALNNVDTFARPF